MRTFLRLTMTTLAATVASLATTVLTAGLLHYTFGASEDVSSWLAGIAGTAVMLYTFSRE